MAGCESLDAAALNENAMSLPTKHGLIEVDAGCEGIVSGSIGVDEMGHANKKERVGGENSFHELRIYHNEELLCAQYREPIGSGRLTLLRLPGQEAAYEYDGGRVSSVTLRDLTEPGRPAATTSFGYNGSGLMAWVNGPRTDVNDHTWFQYDADGNVAERIDSLGHRYLFEYDDSGRLNTMTDPNGLRTQLAVDERESSGYVLAHGDTHALARSKIRMDGRSSERTARQEWPGGRPSIRKTDMTIVGIEVLARNGFGLPVVTSERGRGRVEYEYDQGNNVVRETPEYGAHIERTFDELSRPIHVVRASQSEYEDICYYYDECRNGVGQLCRIDRPNAHVTFLYDDNARLERVQVHREEHGTTRTYKRVLTSDKSGGLYGERTRAFMRADRWWLTRTGNVSRQDWKGRIDRAIGYSWRSSSTDNRWVLQGDGRAKSVAASGDDVLGSDVGHGLLSIDYPCMEVRVRDPLGLDKPSVTSAGRTEFPGKTQAEYKKRHWAAVGRGGVEDLSLGAASHASPPNQTNVTAYRLPHCEGTSWLIRLYDAAAAGYKSYWRWAGSLTWQGFVFDFYVGTPVDENTPTEPPDITSRPPGTCTEAKHRELQDEVNRLCHGARRCEPDDGCDTLKAKADRLSGCIAARERINNTCFLGGNPGHEARLNMDVLALVACQGAIANKCHDEGG